ncbi:hypothetical protein ACLOJK_021532 [Asimina triloba]
MSRKSNGTGRLCGAGRREGVIADAMAARVIFIGSASRDQHLRRISLELVPFGNPQRLPSPSLPPLRRGAVGQVWDFLSPFISLPVSIPLDPPSLSRSPGLLPLSPCLDPSPAVLPLSPSRSLLSRSPHPSRPTPCFPSLPVVTFSASLLHLSASLLHLSPDPSSLSPRIYALRLPPPSSLAPDLRPLPPASLRPLPPPAPPLLFLPLLPPPPPAPCRDLLLFLRLPPPPSAPSRPLLSPLFFLRLPPPPAPPLLFLPLLPPPPALSASLPPPPSAPCMNPTLSKPGLSDPFMNPTLSKPGRNSSSRFCY